MTSTSDQLRKLVEGLYLRTVDRKIEWRFDQGGDLCEANLGNGFVQVLRETDEDGDYYTFVRILDKERVVIDNLYGGSLGGKSTSPVNTSHPNYWELMKDLHSSAKRSALGVDEVLDSMVNALGVEDLDMNDIPF